MEPRLLVVSPDRILRARLEGEPDAAGFALAHRAELATRLVFGSAPEVFLGGRPVGPHRAVFFRKWRGDKPGTVIHARALAALGLPVFETELVRSTYSDKMVQCFELHRRGLRIPDTLFVAREAALDRVDLIEGSLPYPFVMKSLHGRKGEDNHLVPDRAGLERVLDEAPAEVEFLFQRFVPNEGDVRVLVLGGKAARAYRRTRDPAAGTHLNNLARGSRVDALPLDEAPELAATAERCARVLGREVCGVDLLVSSEDGLPRVLEANAAPSVRAPGALDALVDYLRGLGT